ncbi:MAG TPA: cation diffusion facilitator family transporter [Ferrovibrio sp.]|uniref:cation diffusion facilitator family transporter n=1 Tax=Ferrovibrio sp. TaxID=1917215 RepID=UPI002B4B73DF|nr:cation diffusion facilitator family transporter [Ferrovibrio sp.]HLT76564.1 cation diffusion facilitator family transporter [Ferrovibrio sp.]
MTETNHIAGTDPALRARLMRRATYASVSVALLLVAAKLAAWLVTGSMALLASLIDSLLDGLASVVNLLAVRHALTPADREHRFGHGKAEALAGLGQGALIVGSALFLIVESIDRLLAPRPVSETTAGLAVMGLSIVATAALVLYQRHVVKRTGSLAISADRLHYVGDLLTNATVIVALLLASRSSLSWVDPACALVVAGVILKSAYDIVRGALDHLMDRELADEDRERIKAVVRRHPEAQAMHDLRTRQAGNQIFIQFHLELDPEMPLREAHRIGEEIERELMQVFPGAEVIIHHDPAGMVESLPAFAGRTV